MRNDNLNSEFVAKKNTHFAYRFLVVRKLLSEVTKQEVHQRRPKTDLRIVQSDRSIRTNKLDQPIKAFYTDLLAYEPIRAFTTDLLSYRLIKSILWNYFPYRPIRSLLRTSFRTRQSYRSDGPTSVPVNQISPTDLHP